MYFARGAPTTAKTLPTLLALCIAALLGACGDCGDGASRGGSKGAIQAMIERVARVGFEVRVEVVLGDGTPVPILATRDEADALELRAGQLVWLRVHRMRELAP